MARRQIAVNPLEDDEFGSGLRLAWPDNKNIENNPMQSNPEAASSPMVK